ncbi:trigger factor [Mahella australiensis]|uniref:Trigger factor n=1 Tax=Mahella australiensis (strain DSM 15567 / CIP 107919 / 50-1 BON) TaxID=697281 RepID=F4A1Z8_MAHA5|nr:trigger factor [Mahella australiensis]AEE96114.1 trigger factor [Mahella australiensis 50-1 BON]
MGSQLEQLENNVAKLRIEVDAAAFEEAIKKAYRKNVKKFRVPGFRVGKVPQHIVEQYYGESVFYEDAIDDVFPDAYSKAIEENDLTPVDLPQIDIVQIGKGKDLILSADVTVKPEVTLGEYKGIQVKRPVYNVTDEDVEKELEDLRQKNARLIAVEDRASQEGDTVTVDYTGYLDGQEFEGGKAEDQVIELGQGRFIPGFEEQLVGMRVGENKEFNIVFPEDYGNNDLAGKEVTFSVTMKEIKYKELPELDDEFAKDVSEFDTLEELRQSIRERLENEAAQQTQSALENAVIAKVTENSSVDIPDVMVERELDDVLQELDYNLQYNGLSLDIYLQITNTSKEALREQYKDVAHNRLKSRMVLEKIGQVENIEVSPEEVDEEIKKRAEQMNVDVEQYKQRINPSFIEETLRMDKIISFLIENAVVEDVEEDGQADTSEDEA